MESIDIGWASFFQDALLNFSREFQTELSNQLEAKFDAMIGIENYARKNKFQLFVGMTPLKTIFQDGYGFALVEVIDHYSVSKVLTFYWKSDDNENILKSKEVNSENIEIGWCADFDTEYFLNIEKKKLVNEIQNKVLGFNYTANFDLFPDLSFDFEFKAEPTTDQLEEIQKLMKMKFKNSYVSDVSGNELKYLAIIDFQGTEFEDGLTEINQFIRDYSMNDVKKITKSICVN